MNITLLIGSIIAWGMVIFGIIDGSVNSGLSVGDGVMLFVNPAGAAIVMGGTFGCIIASFPLSAVKAFPKFMKLAFMPPKFSPGDYIDQVESFAQTARSKGLLALEEPAGKCEDVFLKQAVMLVVDGGDPDKVRAMLEDSIEFTTERHGVAWAMCERGMALAPSFGMIGTVIGLIIMLVSLSSNPDALGGLMAIAMVTTFYGCIVANIMFAPMRSALKNSHDKEVLCMQLVVEGVMSIAAGSNPRLIREKLEFMLAKSDVKGKDKKSS